MKTTQNKTKTHDINKKNLYTAEHKPLYSTYTYNKYK